MFNKPMPKILLNSEKKLLEAAKEIIEKEGVDNLSMKRLAQQTDMAVGTIYNYFPDKNAILIRIVTEDWHALENTLLASYGDLKTFSEGIRLLYDRFLRFSQTLQPIFSSFTSHGNATYYASYSSFIEEGAKLLEALANHFSLSFIASRYPLAAAMFSYAIHYPDTPYEEIEAAILRILGEPIQS